MAEQQGVELVVVTLTSIEPEAPEVYRTMLFEQWGIGGSEDSGLLIMLVTGSRDIQVEVGYGLEGVLPDGKVGAILDQFVVPHLALNDYNRGLTEAAKAYRAELVGESFILESNSDETYSSPSAFVIFIVLAIVITLVSRKNPPNDPPNSGSGGTHGGTRRRPVVYPTHLPRSGGGRSGGGGFGGFGGGRSGGGGAGRKF